MRNRSLCEPRFPKLPASATQTWAVTPHPASLQGLVPASDAAETRVIRFCSASGRLRPISVDHGRTSPAGTPTIAARDAHAGSGGDGGRSRSVWRRIAANSARDTTTSAMLQAEVWCHLTIDCQETVDPFREADAGRCRWRGHYPARLAPALRLVAEAGEERLRLVRRAADGPDR